MDGFGEQARMRNAKALFQQAAQLVIAVGRKNALHGQGAHGAAPGSGDEAARHAAIPSCRFKNFSP
jgi:hypothetical protein